MTNKFLYIIFIIGLFACSSADPVTENEDSRPLLVDSVVFDTDILFRAQFSGSFSQQGQMYYYFADPVSAKKIQIFKKSGKSVITVNLKNALVEGKAIGYLNVVALDTILLMTKFSGQLFFLNRKGEVWKRMDLTKYLPNHPIYSYEVKLTNENVLYDANNLLISYSMGFKEYDDSEESQYALLAKEWKSPYFIKLKNIWSDTIDTASGFFLQQEVYPSDSTYLMLEPKKYVIADSSVVVVSSFSDQLYKVDLQSLKLIHQQQVASQYDSFEANPINVKQLGYAAAFDSSMSRVFKTPTISSIQYNKVLEHYYVFIVKRLKRPFDPMETKVAFVLQVYDKKLNLLVDIDIDVSRYAGVVLPTEKGFMIQTRASSGNFKNKHAVFHEFSY